MNNPTNYWSSSPSAHPVAWPQWRYHKDKDPVMVNSEEAAAALGEDWSDKYIKRDYPKMKFKLRAEPKEGELYYETTVVADPEAEGKIGAGWSDTVPPAPKQHNDAHTPVAAGDSKKK